MLSDRLARSGAGLFVFMWHLVASRPAMFRLECFVSANPCHFQRVTLPVERKFFVRGNKRYRRIVPTWRQATFRLEGCATMMTSTRSVGVSAAALLIGVLLGSAAIAQDSMQLDTMFRESLSHGNDFQTRREDEGRRVQGRRYERRDADQRRDTERRSVQRRRDEGR
jgi:hypothetical protein